MGTIRKPLGKIITSKLIMELHNNIQYRTNVTGIVRVALNPVSYEKYMNVKFLKSFHIDGKSFFQKPQWDNIKVFRVKFVLEFGY